jgi:hypothetical protein
VLFNPGIGIQDGNKIDPGFRVRDEHPDLISENLISVFWLKILKFFERIRIWDPGSCQPWIRNPRWKKSDPRWKISDPESGISIPDPKNCQQYENLHHPRLYFFQ